MELNFQDNAYYLPEVSYYKAWKLDDTLIKNSN